MCFIKYSDYYLPLGKCRLVDALVVDAYFVYNGESYL